LSLLQSTSHTISTYLRTIEVPASNLFDICFHMLWVQPMNKPIQDNCNTFPDFKLTHSDFKNDVNSSTKTLKASNIFWYYIKYFLPLILGVVCRTMTSTISQ
jgi:hypothetical protein